MQDLKVPYDVVIDAIAILMGDYPIIKKKAAILLLKIAFPSDFVKFLFEDESLYPFDRNDPRVRTWKQIVLSKGKCEICGSKENLEAHHFIKWSECPLGRIDVNNGMCLCHRCHTNEHQGENIYWMMKSKL